MASIARLEPGTGVQRPEGIDAGWSGFKDWLQEKIEDKVQEPMDLWAKHSQTEYFPGGWLVINFSKKNTTHDNI